MAKKTRITAFMAAVPLCVALASVQAQDAPATWKVSDSVDPMTDRPIHTLRATPVAKDGAAFKVSAACRQGVAIAFDFESDNKLAQLQQYPTSNGMHCDTMEYAIGDTSYPYAEDECKGNKHAELDIVNPKALIAAASKKGSQMSTDIYGFDFTSIFGAMQGGTVEKIVKMKYPIEMSDLLSATVLHVGLMVESGSESFIKLDLKGKEIHDLIAKCSGEYRASLPVPVATPNSLATPSATEPFLLDDFIARVPGMLDKVEPCTMRNLETCVRSGSYNPEIQTLKRTLFSCQSLSPEIAAALPESYIKKQLPECFGGFHYLTPVTDASTNRTLQKNWLGVRITPQGPLSDGKGYDVEISLGTLSSNTLRIVPGTLKLPQNHSTPQQVSRMLSTLPPGTLNPRPETNPAPGNLAVANTPKDDSSKKIVLTKANPAANGHAIITAPGRGNHRFNVFYVDTQDFSEGGTLNVDVTVDRSSQATGAFNIFKGDTPIPTSGYLPMSLANAYQIPVGQTGHLHYHFQKGTILAFGAEGNWADKEGQTGEVTFNIRVSK